MVISCQCIYHHIYMFREWEGQQTLKRKPDKVLGDPVLREYYKFEPIR